MSAGDGNFGARLAGRKFWPLPARARDFLWLTLIALLAIGALALFQAIAGEAALAAAVAVAVFAIALYLAEDALHWRASQPRPLEGERDRKALLAAIAASALERLPDPFLLLEQSGHVALSSRAAADALGAVPGRQHISSVIRNPRLLESVRRVLGGGEAEFVDYASLVPVERHYRAHVCPLAGPEPGGHWALILIHDLTAMKRVEAMRADFVANASHELRTPLASVAGFIETLRGHAKDDPEARARFLDIMYEQATRMRRLIDDLLSLSRIELNEHVQPTGEVDVLAAVRDVADALAPLAAERGMKIRVEAPSSLPAVTGARDEIVQVFQNLVDNAIKYGGRGKDIVVSCAVEQPAEGYGAKSLAVSVRDFGEGIAREHLPRLTERFYRVDVKRSREQGGTGLGLAIVKHILVRHRGWLTVESEPGKGSIFTVHLPLGPALVPTV